MKWLFLVSLIWAFSFGIIKNQLAGIPPVVVVILRLFIALFVFLPFLQVRKISSRHILQLCAAGGIQYGVMYIAYQYAFIFLRSYEVALFTIFTPVYVALFHRYFGGNSSRLFLLTAVMAVLGTGIAVWQSLPHFDVWLGIIILQGSNLCFAFGQIYYKQIMRELTGIHDYRVIGWLYLGGTLTACLGALVFPGNLSFELSGMQFISILYLGAVASGLGFFLWNLGARKVNNGALGVFNNLKIPLAILVSVLVFKEQAETANLVIGGSLVFAALLLNERLTRSGLSTATE